MSPAAREKAIAEMIADGYSREAAEHMIALETGEADGDLVGPTDQQSSAAA